MQSDKQMTPELEQAIEKARAAVAKADALPEDATAEESMAVAVELMKALVIGQLAEMVAEVKGKG